MTDEPETSAAERPRPEALPAEVELRDRLRAIFWKHLGGDRQYGAIKAALDEVMTALAIPPAGGAQLREFVQFEKRKLAETIAKALQPDRDLGLNPLYVGDPAWRVATAIQDSLLALAAPEPGGVEASEPSQVDIERARKFLRGLRRPTINSNVPEGIALEAMFGWRKQENDREREAANLARVGDAEVSGEMGFHPSGDGGHRGRILRSDHGGLDGGRGAETLEVEAQSPATPADEGEVERLLVDYANATWMEAQSRDTAENSSVSQSRMSAETQADNWAKKAAAAKAAILAAIRPSSGVAVPEGMRLVPISPTKQMADAGMTAAEDALDTDYESNIDGDCFAYTALRSDAPSVIYAAMIAAAPTPTSAGEVSADETSLVESLRADLRRVQANTAEYRQEAQRGVEVANRRARDADERAAAHKRVRDAVLAACSRPPANVDRILEVPRELRDGAEEAELALWRQEVQGNAIRFVAELATMTDTEADALDGHEIREVARMLQVPDEDGERAPTVPRLYTDDDRSRAIAELRARYDPENQKPDRKVVTIKPGEMVDMVAEALGMRKAGA